MKIKNESGMMPSHQDNVANTPMLRNSGIGVFFLNIYKEST